MGDYPANKEEVFTMKSDKLEVIGFTSEESITAYLKITIWKPPKVFYIKLQRNKNKRPRLGW